MIKLATIGTSSICDSFLQGVATLGCFTLEAVYSRKLETGKVFAEKHGAKRVFTSIEDMAKCPDIDAVYIASPNSFHVLQSRLFLHSGKHVLCEKPIVTNSAEYIELKRLADKNRLIYMEAIISHHNPKYKAIKAALSEIGAIKSASIIFHQKSSRLDEFLKGEDVNIFNMSLRAGTLMDIGVYCVYGAVDLLGLPNSVTATKKLLYNGADGFGTAEFNYGDFVAKLSYSKTEQSDEPSVIVGEKGVLKIDKISQYAGVRLIKDGKETKITDHFTKPQQMSSEAKHFADYILRFKENEQDYLAASKLCFDVHKCMDYIKTAAGIKYPKE